MAATAQDLYLVLRVRNETTRALNQFSTGFGRLAKSAQLAGLQAQRAHEMSAVAALKHAQAEGRMASASIAADRAAIQQAIGVNTLEKAYKQLEISQLRVRAAQLRGTQGSQEERAAIRASITARQHEINGITQETLRLREHSTALQRDALANREVAAQMQKDVAGRRAAVAAIDADIKKTNEATEAKKKHAAALGNAGQAMESAGLVMAAAGIIGLVGINKMTDAAMEYNRTVALTMTQIDGEKTSLTELGNIGKRVASEIGAPFNQMQGALYDIFSSMDIKVKDSEGVLRSFAKTAVAGQVSMETSGRATIGILNAFHIKIQDVSHVQDVMFQLVRKGVGTYEQFAETIGRAVPSAARAGQEVETLAGMMAFLTRNGLSAAMAAASAGRAFDAFANSKTVDKLEAMGITVKRGVSRFVELAAVMGKVETAVKAMPITQRTKFLAALGIAARDSKGHFRAFAEVATDLERVLKKMSLEERAKVLTKLGIAAKVTRGEFRPFTDVIVDLQDKLKDMTSPERAAALQELFKSSGGTIQARRFYDAVLKNKQSVQDFVRLVQSMRKSEGEAEKAYGMMAETTAVRTQIMKNRFSVLKTELGEALLPAFTRVVNGLIDFLDWFNKLSDSSKKWLAYSVAITAGLLLLGGVILSVAGFFVALAAAAAIAEVSLLAIVATVGLIILAVGAVIVAWVLAYKKIKWFHDAVNWWFGHIGMLAKWLWEEAIKPAFEGIANGAVWLWEHALKPAFYWIKDTGIPSVVTAAQWLWDKMKAVWDGIASGAKFLWDALKVAWNGIVTGFNALGTAANFVWRNILQPVFNAIAAVVKWLVDTVWRPHWNRLLMALDVAWASIQVVFGLIMIGLKIVGLNVVALYKVFVQPYFNYIAMAAGFLWTMIKKAFDNIMLAVKFVGALFVWLWEHPIKSSIDKIMILFGIWKNVTGAIFSAMGDLIAFVWNKKLKPIFDIFADIVKRVIPKAFNDSVGAIKAAWEKVRDITKAPVKFVVETVINGGILAAYNKLADLFNVKPKNVKVDAKFAEGGRISGPGGPREDKVPIWASNGEFIVNARSAAKHGRALREINADKYADGGPIGWLKDKVSATAQLLKNPIGAITGLASKATDLMKDKVLDSTFGQILKNMGTKVVTGIKDKLLAFHKSGALGGGDAGTGRFNTRGGWPPKRGNSPPWSPNVASAANFIRNSWPGMSIGSYVSPYSWSDHYPKAIDNMTNAHNAAGLARGNAVASWFAANPNAFGTNYIIWNKRITSGQGWGPYSVPGQGDHTNHVHLSFYRDGGKVARTAQKAMEGNGDVLAALRPGEMVVPAFHQGGIVGGRGERLPLPQMMSGGTKQVSQEINVYTQEIDPRLHAEQLGWELLRKS